MPVCYGGYSMLGILVVVVVRNARVCVDSIADVVLRKGRIVKPGISLPSRDLRCLQQRLFVCRLEKLPSDNVGFH